MAQIYCLFLFGFDSKIGKKCFDIVFECFDYEYKRFDIVYISVLILYIYKCKINEPKFLFP